MTTKKTPVEYAEVDLKVHETFHDAWQVNEAHSAAVMRRVTQMQKLRECRDDIEYREHEIVTDLRGKYMDASEAALTRAVKLAFKDDTHLQSLSRMERVMQGEIDGTDAEIDSLKSTLKLLTARLSELGGLLNFYAAAKAAAATRHS